MTDRNDEHRDARTNGNGLRRPISEAEVLAVVEQIADPSETIGASRDAGLAARLDAMRLDREALVSLAEVTAPDTLVDHAIRDALDGGVERRALLGLAAQEQSQTGIVASKVRVSRDRFLEQVLDRPLRWGISAAAAALLMLGSGAFLIAKQLDGRVQADAPDAVIAFGDSEPAAGLPAGAADPAAPEQPRDAEPPLAIAAAPPDASAWTIAQTLSEAADALEDGRLVLRVSIPANVTPADAIAAVASSSPSSAGRSWRVAAAPLVLDVSPSGPAPTLRSLALALRGARDGKTPDVAARSVTVWPATLRRRATSLAAMRDAFERSGFEVELIRIAEPVAMPQPLDADAVSWWNQPPASWPDRAVVPVLVERPAR